MTRYRAIADWTAAGRAKIVANHELEIRCLLEEAFSTFLDAPHTSLRAYSFAGDDAVVEAADWALRRFRDGDIDPAQLNPEDRCFRLFTRVNFWLAQKAGKDAHRRIESERQRRSTGNDTAKLAGNTASGAGGSSTAFAVARTLKELAARTCPGLVEYWLHGSTRMRAEWFGWDPEVPALPEGVSGKGHSFFTADALFRFSALFARLLPVGDQRSDRACVATWFTPCDDLPPFRVHESKVALRLGLATPRDAQKERHTGLVELIRRVLAAAEKSVGARDADGAVLRAGLRAGLLHAYKIEDSGLGGRLAALPREV